MEQPAAVPDAEPSFELQLQAPEATTADVDDAGAALLDDEAAPAMRYESIRVAPTPLRYGLPSVLLQGPEVVRKGVCKARRMNGDDAGPAWTLWVQFLYALLFVLIIVIVLCIMCSIWQVLARSSSSSSSSSR